MNFCGDYWGRSHKVCWDFTSEFPPWGHPSSGGRGTGQIAKDVQRGFSRNRGNRLPTLAICMAMLPGSVALGHDLAAVRLIGMSLF